MMNIREIMNKKLGLILASVLIISALIPIISTVIAKKPNNVPPPLEKKVFIHYKRGNARPPWAGGGNGGGNENEDSGEYKLLAKGVKWKTFPVTYVIDPDNSYGLTQAEIVSAFSISAEEWDDHTGTELFGSYSIDTSSTWDDDVPDGRNELLFDNYPDSGVIAVTIIWGYFSGPPPTREIVEFDILFNTDFTWGDAAIDPNVMDLRNIATHELGHGAGLADLYDSSAIEETMYGYSGYGEISKRDLFIGDIAGIQDLYGQ